MSFEQILGGRMTTALVLLASIVVIPCFAPLGRLITRKAPETTGRENWEVGHSAQVNLTIITPDFRRLACSSDQRFGDNHCSYDSAGKAIQPPAEAPRDDNKKHILQPYRSTDKQLLLIPGLWAQPEVATRLHEEPFLGVPDKRLARFVVSCTLDFQEEWNNVRVRWNTSAQWSDQGKAMVAVPRNCKVVKIQP
ncbi:MAG: hypothetical protein MK135_08725 [Polyangiaceae bacterium]|nr:hypothetical protein [Polyangiaceae bacterium]